MEDNKKEELKNKPVTQQADGNGFGLLADESAPQTPNHNSLSPSQLDEIRKSISSKNPKLYNIAIEGGTEAPFSGKYLNEHADGVFHCAVCDVPLFKSENKFESGTGWPSFDRPITSSAVDYIADDSFGMRRTEVRCKNCGAHLGHLFDDGPAETTGQRYCINSVCLDLAKEVKDHKANG